MSEQSVVNNDIRFLEHTINENEAKITIRFAFSRGFQST